MKKNEKGRLRSMKKGKGIEEKVEARAAGSCRLMLSCATTLLV